LIDHGHSPDSEAAKRCPDIAELFVCRRRLIAGMANALFNNAEQSCDPDFFRRQPAGRIKSAWMSARAASIFLHAALMTAAAASAAAACFESLFTARKQSIRSLHN
jgi:hypothetical protein